MMESTNKDYKRKTMNKKQYSNFIKELDIKDIRLISATIENLDCGYSPKVAEVRWRMAASYENEENAIEVMNRYNVRILEQGKELKAKFAVTFCVTYTSKTPMSEDFFERFKNQNLPLNTWPYFREYIHNTLLRMGWPPFIAPTLKR